MNIQPLTTQQVAEIVGGDVQGDPTLVVTGFSPMDRASATDLIFADRKHANAVAASSAGAAIVEGKPDTANITLIRVKSVDVAVADLLEYLAPDEDMPLAGFHPSAVIAADAEVADDVAVGPNVTVGSRSIIGSHSVLCAGVSIAADVTIGEDTILFQGVVVRERCSIGSRVRIGPNSVIGYDGFGYIQSNDGGLRRVRHIPGVVIEDDVDLGACVCVDRGKLVATRIGTGSKVDNQVQIAHSVEIGQHCILVAQCGIAGSARLGRGVQIGGKAGVKQNTAIGDKAKLAAYSATMRDVPAGETYTWIPALPHRKALRVIHATHMLPDLMERVKRLEKECLATPPNGNLSAK